MNFLTLVLDSCRYDTFCEAQTQLIADKFNVVKANAMATFTYPAHAAMLQGFYPHSDIMQPIYNRFNCSLFKWFYRSSRHSVINLHPAAAIPTALQKRGYYTVALGGVGWFKAKSPLRIGFDHFEYNSKCIKSLKRFMHLVKNKKFFGLINFGETHRPYTHDSMDKKLSSIECPQSGKYPLKRYRPELYEKQVSSARWVMDNLSILFDWLNVISPTLVCICADHGECFGEDSYFGHGFYHPKVMEVPLGWSLFMPGQSTPITYNSLAKYADLFTV